MAIDFNEVTLNEGLEAGARALAMVHANTEGPIQGVALSALILLEQVTTGIARMNDSAEAQEENN